MKFFESPPMKDKRQPRRQPEDHNFGSLIILAVTGGAPSCWSRGWQPRHSFNLACYASVTGRTEEAKERLRHAMDLDKDICGLALDDEDLKRLWDWIAGLE